MIDAEAGPNEDVLAWITGTAGMPETASLLPPEHDPAALDLLVRDLDEATLERSTRVHLAAGNVAIAAALSRARATRALASGQTTAAIEWLRQVILLDETAPIPRLQLAGLIHDRLTPQELADLTVPALPYMIDRLAAFPIHLSFVVIAAFRLRRFELIGEIADAFARDPEAPALTCEAFAIARRLTVLRAWPGWDRPERSDEWQRHHFDARWALDEHAMLASLHALCGASARGTLADCAVLAAVSRERRWDRAHDLCLALASMHLDGISLEEAADIWCGFGLPGATIAAAARRTARADPDEVAGHRARFAARPSLDHALLAWNAAARAGDAEHVLLYASNDALELEAARLSRTTRDADEPCRPIWIFMTWRDHAARLLSDLANLASGEGRRVISIGGDGDPVDLSQATAALLSPGIFFLHRAPISWGGRKLLFETVLEVMQTFVRLAPEGAWMQVLCDRSLPLIGMDELGARAARAGALERYRFVTKPEAWQGEFTPDQLDNLPALMSEAIDDIFASADFTAMDRLAGSCERYPDPDFRIKDLSINFTGDPMPVTDSGRLGAQTYAISPYDIDAKWMSFARLQSFVDTATEGGPTYMRRQPRYMMDWIFNALRPLRMRNGDPFGFMSRRYANEVLSHPHATEILAAMSCGFGPEMNFFDTMASTLSLENNYLHMYKRPPGEIIVGTDLPAIAWGADVEGSAFTRKTEPDLGKPVQDFFAERLMRADCWREMNWVAASEISVARDTLPVVLDERLVTCLVDQQIMLRDLLGRRSHVARFTADGFLRSDDGAIDAWWKFVNGALIVDFQDPAHGAKAYANIASDAHSLILVPRELVAQHNGWSLFIVVPLALVTSGEDVELTIAPPQTGSALRWNGGPRVEACLLASFADGAQALPTATVRASGRVCEFRRVDVTWLALAEIDGWPALLRLRGAAQSGGQSRLLFSKAAVGQVENWSLGTPGYPDFRLARKDVSGRWTLERIEGETELVLRSDGVVGSPADGRRLGAWCLTKEGLRLYGLKGLSSGIAHQWRVENGRWRLSGWGEAMIGRRVTFALVQRS